MRAELLAAMGRSREAIDWYAALGLYPGEEMAYLGPSRLRMGEIYERLGETREALEQYARFVTLWRDCDPELQPMVIDAHRRIAKLRRRLN